MGLMYGVSAVTAVAFVALYTVMAKAWNARTGVVFGALFGIASGFPMGFGTYCVMPVPIFMSVVWFVGALVQMTLAGLITGLILAGGDSKAQN